MGTKGEIGLMQLARGAGEDYCRENNIPLFARDDLFDPEFNIRVGTWYLGRAIDSWSKYKDPYPYALAEYNAGRSRALEWEKVGGGESRAFWEAVGIPSTKKYIQVILTRYRGKV